MKTEPEKLLQKYTKLVHTDNMKVISHVQRAVEDWVINTVMVKGCEVPFRYKRKQFYRDLKGACVNLTYYPTVEYIAGIELEVMKVVRIKIA